MTDRAAAILDLLVVESTKNWIVSNLSREKLEINPELEIMLICAFNCDVIFLYLRKLNKQFSARICFAITRIILTLSEIALIKLCVVWYKIAQMMIQENYRLSTWTCNIQSYSDRFFLNNRKNC